MVRYESRRNEGRGEVDEGGREGRSDGRTRRSKGRQLSSLQTQQEHRHKALLGTYLGRKLDHLDGEEGVAALLWPRPSTRRPAATERSTISTRTCTFADTRLGTSELISPFSLMGSDSAGGCTDRRVFLLRESLQNSEGLRGGEPQLDAAHPVKDHSDRTTNESTDPIYTSQLFCCMERRKVWSDL